MQWLMEQTSQIDVAEERATTALLGEEEGDEAARRKGSKLGKGGDEWMRSLYEDASQPPAMGVASGRRATRSASKASPLGLASPRASPLARSASLFSARLSSRYRL